MPERSLRIIFSVSSPCSSSVAASNDCSDSCPALLRSLWQVTQYCLTSAVCSAGSIVVAAGACDAAGLTWRLKPPSLICAAQPAGAC